MKEVTWGLSLLQLGMDVIALLPPGRSWSVGSQGRPAHDFFATALTLASAPSGRPCGKQSGEFSFFLIYNFKIELVPLNHAVSPWILVLQDIIITLLLLYSLMNKWGELRHGAAPPPTYYSFPAP